MCQKSVIGVFWFDIALRTRDISGLDFATSNRLQAIHEAIDISAIGNYPKTGAYHPRQIDGQASHQTFAGLLRVGIGDT